MSVVNKSFYDSPYDIIIEFLRENKYLMERIVTIYERMIEDTIEQKYLEEFEEFVASRNKIHRRI